MSEHWTPDEDTATDGRPAIDDADGHMLRGDEQPGVRAAEEQPGYRVQENEDEPGIVRE